MKEYETETKGGKIEKRVFIDSGSFVIYGYETDGKMDKKVRLVLNGRNGKRSYFIIPTGNRRSLAIDADYEDDVFVLKDGQAVKVRDLFGER
ncbi:hypothetical protein [Thermoplasma acidophilum]|uniref:Uncharacterized protein n=1 Tax=Thermoplasma acidophilum (strain ATCC 25905 / DSM 1728 / JCM 9062 / NBRC 15155 / AMRC-C165) TaxID=273075 RepID=Q9HI88_THEAC|nr:hypothetical protein [Thermoplasma acidophilum]MCY0851339.1 hypothetical protein [Thermoplasma acidophilum]CAC12574.1 hypothetical protein [Thermoplasma acidophilum]